MDDYRYQKTPEELREALERQVRHLRRSNKIYDEGHIEEAERIAAALYVLFADYSSNKALTGLTKVKKQLRFPDTRINAGIQGDEHFVGPFLCLVGPHGEYLPVLGGNGNETWPLVPFQKWWNETVYETEAGLSLSRKNLVFALGNQDGGRHVDSSLRDKAYHWLKTRGDTHVRLRSEGGYTIFHNPKWLRSGQWVNLRGFGDGKGRLHVSTIWPPPDDAQPLKNGHWVTMRQMGWEADQAFIALRL